jgi:hypothetical protein
MSLVASPPHAYENLSQSQWFISPGDNPVDLTQIMAILRLKTLAFCPRARANHLVQPRSSRLGTRFLLLCTVRHGIREWHQYHSAPAAQGVL